MQQRIDTYTRQQYRYGHNCCKHCFGKEASFKEARRMVMLTNNPFKGKTHTQETKAIIANAATGRSSWNVGLTKYTSDLIKMAGEKSSVFKKSQNLVGSKNPNWRGGSSIFNRNNDFFTTWLPFRQMILEQDCYKCYKCDNVKPSGSGLEIHHIVSKAKYPDLKYEETNCIVLCKKCHKEFHNKYGRINFYESNTYNWLNESRTPENYFIPSC